jgi:hypothetical protein
MEKGPQLIKAFSNDTWIPEEKVYARPKPIKHMVLVVPSNEILRRSVSYSLLQVKHQAVGQKVVEVCSVTEGEH